MATWGRHGLHPVTKRPKTATEKLKDHLADGGEGYSSGARGATPAILGMNKATNGQNGGGGIEAERRAWKAEGKERGEAYRRASRKLGISDEITDAGNPPDEWSASMYERDAPKYPHFNHAQKVQAELSVRRKENIQNLSKADEDPPRKPIKDMTGDERVEAYKQGKIRINRSYRPGQPQHPTYAKKQKKIDNKETSDPPWWVYMKGGGHTGTSTKRGAYYARDIQKLDGKQTKARVVDSAGADIHGLPYVKSIEHAGESFSGYNKPKRTPSHPKKSHAVVAKEGSKTKLIRFGQQGVSGEGKSSPSDSPSDRARRRSFKARHSKNIKRGRMSAAYWADKVKW